MGLFTTSATNIPSCRVEDAIARGVEKNLLFCVGGGLGDQICAEPTLRYALKNFKDCKVSLYAYHPELFAHLKFENVFLYGEKFNEMDYFWLPTYPRTEDFINQFFTPNSVNLVDFISLHALRCQLPVPDREIFIQPTEFYTLPLEVKNPVIVHAGLSWQSRTFPVLWWNCLIEWIVHCSMTPVLIGTQGVDVDASKCFDLRGKLSILQSIDLLQKERVLITNDSSPLHMASTRHPSSSLGLGHWSGHCYVEYIATAKHPDLLTHVRHGELGYRMQNHSRGGLWQQNHCPNKRETLDMRQVDENELISWLPDPQYLAEWAREKWDADDDDFN